jgi:hypothetical protein
MLCACARIEAHDEVMAIVVGRLQFLRRLWEEKGAPVGDTANDAVLLKNDPASGFGDSGRRISVRSPGYAQRSCGGGGCILFYFREAAGSYLPLSATSIATSPSPGTHTTPIISYSILTVLLVLPSRCRSFPREKWSLSENRRAAFPISSSAD